MTHRDEPPPAAPPHAALPPRMQKVDVLAGHRRLLLLQGPNGPFFRRLALRLRTLGAEVTRVNFNAGDDLFHPRSDALCFAGSAQDWPGYLELVLRERRIEALVLFGQERPLHRLAIEVATRLGIEIVVFEEGYVRPCWITMEYGGVNGRSVLMQPLSAWPAAEPAPQAKQREAFTLAFWAMAFYTFAYGMWGVFFRSRYPKYVHHKPLQAVQMLYWIRGALRRGLYALRQRGTLRRLCATDGPRFFLVPLQMAGDSQITHHSAWGGIEPFIGSVMRSFAAHAPADEWLVFKHHPLELGHAHYGRCIEDTARALGISDRVRYVHGGHLPSLLARARGVVVVNSTVGLQALHHGTPVIACGRAIYAKPGLTDPRPLDDFWQQPHAPDPAVFERFLRGVIALSQVNASFYAPDGAWSRAEIGSVGAPLPAPAPPRLRQAPPAKAPLMDEESELSLAET